jgi:hypothetical protein
MTGQFLTSGVLIDFDDAGRHGVLKRAVVYRDAAGRVHHALPGLKTDGRSGAIGYYVVGQPFRTKHLRCAIVHDWYCAIACMMDRESYCRLRKSCDLLFRESLAAVGVPRWKRWAMYRAVRGHAWWKGRRHEPQDWSVHFTSRAAARAHTAHLQKTPHK